MTGSNSFEKLRSGLMELYTDGKYVAALDLVQKNEPNFPEQAARTTIQALEFIFKE